jgi:hypothetical protein
MSGHLKVLDYGICSTRDCVACYFIYRFFSASINVIIKEESFILEEPYFSKTLILFLIINLFSVFNSPDRILSLYFKGVFFVTFNCIVEVPNLNKGKYWSLLAYNKRIFDFWDKAGLFNKNRGAIQASRGLGDWVIIRRAIRSVGFARLMTKSFGGKCAND